MNTLPHVLLQRHIAEYLRTTWHIHAHLLFRVNTRRCFREMGGDVRPHWVCATLKVWTKSFMLSILGGLRLISYLHIYVNKWMEVFLSNTCAFGYQDFSYYWGRVQWISNKCRFSYIFKTSTFHFILSAQLVVYTHCSQYNEACECVLTIARVSLECLNETDEYLWSVAPVGISVCNSKNHLGRGTIAWSGAGCPG